MGVVPSQEANKGNLPEGSKAILDEAKVNSNLSIEELNNGVFLSKSMKYWVDKNTNANCFYLYARELSIIWGADKRYWRWTFIKESDEKVEIAELLNVCWLQIDGKFEISKLTPGKTYEVVFDVQLKDDAYGWDVPITLTLKLPDEYDKQQPHTEILNNNPRSKWFQIVVGKFTVKENQIRGPFEFSLCGSEGWAWKRGLLVKGAAIRVA